MLIDIFFQKGRQFLGSEFPIIWGAMTRISDHKLVSAIGNAGGFGMLDGKTDKGSLMAGQSVGRVEGIQRRRRN